MRGNQRILRKEWRRIRAFSVIEFMISAVILAALVAGSMGVIASLKRSQASESERSSLMLRSGQISQIIGQQLTNAVMLIGETNSGTHFGSSPVFGIMRVPDSAPSAGDTWDSMQIFVLDIQSSVQPTFTLADLSLSAGASQITLEGDFRSIFPLAEDLFAIRNSDRVELFEVNGSVSYNSTDDESVFSVDQDASNFEDNVLSPEISGAAEVFRVSRLIFRVGDGADRETGLFMMKQGRALPIASEVLSIQIFYQLNSRDGLASADCASKSNTRYFSHATSDTECDWNDIRSIRMETVLGSKMSSFHEDVENPHTGAKEKRVMVVQNFALTPTSYTSSITD